MQTTYDVNDGESYSIKKQTDMQIHFCSVSVRRKRRHHTSRGRPLLARKTEGWMGIEGVGERGGGGRERERA